MSQSISVAFICPYFCPGGVPRTYLSIAESLHDCGFSFHCINPFVDDFQQRFRSVATCVHIPDESQIIDYLKEQRIAIVHTTNYGTGNYLAYLAGVPCIIERLDGIASAFMEEKYPVDCIIASTPAGYEQAQRVYPHKEHVMICNGVDISRFNPNHRAVRRTIEGIPVDADDIVIGYMGRIARPKRLEMVIDAFALLADTYPTIKLLLAGIDHKRGYREFLQGRIDEYHLSDRIWVLAGSERPEEIMRVFDIGVICSGMHIDYTGVAQDWTEGLSNSVMEMMSMGLPMVATDCGENNVLVDDGINGFIIAQKDMDGLCRSLATLIENEQLRTHMGSMSRRIIETKYSIHRMANDYRILYRSALARHAHTESVDMREHWLGNRIAFDCLSCDVLESVLVIRSGSHKTVERLVAQLRGRSGSISMMLHEKNFEQSCELGVDELIVHRASDGFYLQDMTDTIADINNRRYSALFVIFNDFLGRGSENIAEIVRHIEIEHKYVMSTVSGEYVLCRFPAVQDQLTKTLSSK